jgi:hypothetical protein
MPHVRHLFAAWALSCVAPHVASAYRPFDGTDADVAAFGEFELELAPIGYLRGPTENHLGESGNTMVLSAVVANFGFAPGWEFVAQTRGLVNFGARGVKYRGFAIDDSGVFVKHVFKDGTLQGKPGVSIAVEMGFLLPQQSTDDVGFSVDAIASYRWRNVTAHLDVQASLTEDDHFDVFAGLILEGPDRWRVRPVAELFVEDELDARTQQSLLLGVIARVDALCSFDLAGRVARQTESGGPSLGLEARVGLTLTLDTKLH